MKLQELPSPYRELAEMRRTDESDFLTGIFKWGSTPEGTDFWAKVNIGYLPEIPASSLAELAEWQKSKGEKVEPTQNDIEKAAIEFANTKMKDYVGSSYQDREYLRQGFIEGANYQAAQELKTEPTLIGGKTEQEWLYLFAGQAMAKNIDFSEGYAQLLMGSDKPKEWYLEVDWWRQAEAKYMIEQAKALLTQLKKEVENV